MPMLLAVVLYASAIPLALYVTPLAIACYVIVALIWLIPDRRIEKALSDHHEAQVAGPK